MLVKRIIPLDNIFPIINNAHSENMQIMHIVTLHMLCFFEYIFFPKGTKKPIYKLSGHFALPPQVQTSRTMSK